MISSVLSDGNTGVARGAFIAARKAKKEIWSYIALDELTDDGPLPDVFKGPPNCFYKCKSGPVWLENVRADISTVTLILYASAVDADNYADVEEACRQNNKPFVKYLIDIDGETGKQATEIREALFQTDVADIRLNVIGPRETAYPGVQKAVAEILTTIFVVDAKTYSWDPWHFNKMTLKLKDNVAVPEGNRYIIPYEYREVTEAFFQEFYCWEWFAKISSSSSIRPHRGGHFKHRINASDGFSLAINATVDPNERLVSFEAEAIKHSTSPDQYESRVGSDHLRTTFQRRALTEDDCRILRELLDRCTTPRAPALAQLLCGTPRSLGNGTNVCIRDNQVVYTGETWSTGVSLQLFYEFLEWSYSYLECFTYEKFVQVNFPWSYNGNGLWSLLMSTLRFSDPRRIYSYAYVLEAYLERLCQVHRLYYQYQNAWQDVDFLKKNIHEIKANLKKCFGIEYVEG